MNSKQKLVVEVVRARNLMPKDGQGSSSAFVEVEFENLRQRTKVKHKDLNPVWKEKLVFDISNVADLRYRAVEVNVFNERKSGSNRNFLGKVRISCSNIAKEVEEIPQLYPLEKRSLFSHVRGEVSLKLYLSTKEQITKKGYGNEPATSSSFVKNQKNMHQQTTPGSLDLQPHNQQRPQQKQLTQDNKWPQPPRQQPKPVEPNPGEFKPVVFTTGPGPSLRTPNISGVGGSGGGGGTGDFSSSGLNEFTIKETNPHLGGGSTNKDKNSSTHDLVEQMQYLYVRVFKARDFSIFGGGEVVAEVKLGNYKGITKRASLSNPEWDQVFAFSKDSIQSSMVEVFVKETNKNDYLGRIWFDLNEVPKRVPPDSQLAPQWYRMEDKRGEKARGGEVMVSVWFGTQADEAFAEAWQSKAANLNFDGVCSIKSKVYLSPKLWYLRVTIIEAQDIVSGEKGSTMTRSFSELSAKAQVGNQVMKTRVASAVPNRSLSNPFWNEDMMFVVAEPFEDYLMVSVEDRIGPGRDNLLGRVLIPVASIERLTDDEPAVSKWFTLDTHCNNMGLAEPKVVTRFGSRIHIRLSLDGGYHVLDESALYSSDVRPTVKQLWKPHIGVLEMGILGATGLTPMKIKDGKGGSTDAYCVAKYGQKWVRTRTAVDSLAPKWNEQYSWEVFDPCTIITVGVFDNSHTNKSVGAAPGAGAGAVAGARDSPIGKVRIRLSTLESNRVYTHSYPLLMLQTSGVKKMGELHLAIRLTCANMANVLHMYPLPLLPKMHYVRPLSVNQLESLRHQALNVVATRLSRAEPPLNRDVVEYMLDHGSHMWSMRRSKANFFRIISVLSSLIAFWKWVESVRSWQKPVHSVLFLIVFLVFDIFPELILPFIFLSLSLSGLWRYPSRPRHPPHMDTRLSCAEMVYGDELDEEFDTFPTRRSADIIRARYDRLRSVAGRIQTVVGDLATQGERLQALLSWRDPRATLLFMVSCLIVAMVFYVVPFRVVVGLCGLYALRPPKFKSKLPSPALSFFRRLPSKADTLL
ncbi:FT-interacting protein 3-like [Macadamia integrifolia]|uniref:FT-interacting protein 3-like n=1 Tax=Macadamia integrifolia TaxID=60698 RepID=UPI001C4EAADE|nr:FT-interacting protein 3-like [Macadamia integrifolia]